MEKCKFCEAELEEESTLCPQCGKDNAELTEQEEAPALEEAAEETEEVCEETEETEETAGEDSEAVTLEEAEELAGEVSEKEATPIKKGKTGLIALTVAVLVLLIGFLAAMVLSGAKQEALPRWLQFFNEDRANVPKDGDPSNETCKGTYTADAKRVLKNMDTVVATAGGYELTLGELQIYYWQEVSGWLNQYGSYAPYFGLDPTQPLDTQMCPIMEGRTWQQYFLATALNSWHTYLAMDVEATAAGFELETMYTDYLAQLPEAMAMEAAAGGFASTEELLAYYVGEGPTVEMYGEFMRRYYHGYGYYNLYCTTVTATDEEVEALFALREAEYAANGLTRETKTVDVRHILIVPETGADGSVTEEAWATAEAEATALMDQWIAEGQSEEGFAALAAANTQDPGSATTGGLYTGVSQGQTVPAFDEWCFDPARQVGDYGLVKTEYGYHIMFYSGETFIWRDLVAEDVKNEKINAMVDAALEKLPLSVIYKKIYLGQAGMFA